MVPTKHIAGGWGWGGVVGGGGGGQVMQLHQVAKWAAKCIF